jgi:hypothetical protein
LPYSIRSQSRGKLGRPSLPKADEFAIDREAVWEVGEFGHEAGHVPAATALDAELSVAADERAEAVPFGFERVAAARRKAAGAKEHRFGEPHTPSLAAVIRPSGTWLNYGSVRLAGRLLALG